MGAERFAPTRYLARVTPLTRELRMLLSMFAGLALVAGFLLFPLAQETDRFFSWTIQPPLTAAFMGAAYWAAFVLIGWAARAGTWELARPALVPVTTIAVLLLVATLVHLDKFDMDSIFGWFWLVVYCSVPPVLAVLVWAQARRPAGPAAPGRPIPAPLRATLLLQAVVMGGLGMVMYVEPSTAGDLWPWALTPLTARAVSAFLIGFAAAAAYAAWDNRLMPLRRRGLRLRGAGSAGAARRRGVLSRPRRRGPHCALRRVHRHGAGGRGGRLTRGAPRSAQLAPGRGRSRRRRGRPRRH